MARANKEFDKLMFGSKRNPKRNPKNYRWRKKLETTKDAKRDYVAKYPGNSFLEWADERSKEVILWERKPIKRHWDKDARDAVWVEKKHPTGWQVYTEKASCDCGLGMPVFNKPVSKKEAMQAAMKKRKRFPRKVFPTGWGDNIC
tara:strand:+ start:7 stop:441 length:435 start_codon:yes stop_codon:yes gene_type:complete